MSSTPDTVPPVRFAQARGARLAYQVVGQGPWLVAIPPSAQNIEVAWEWPGLRHMLERLAAFSQLVVFDKRGTGASDRHAVGGLDERVDDLRAVMDDAGVDRAHLLGVSEGGPMALLFAATYPDRVRSVTLVSSGARLHPDLTEVEVAARREAHRRFASLWGTAESPVVDVFAPSLASDTAYRRWHRRYERLSATPASLVDLLDLTFEMDVTEVLAEVRAPLLVVHRTGDRVFPIERARELVEQVEGSVLLEQEGRDHFAYAGDVDGWVDELERWVTGDVSPVPTPAPTRSRIRVLTLGRFAVEVDGEEIPVSSWGTRRSRQLLKRLVVARGRPVRRDELFTLLWPGEVDRARLGARLSVQLSTVRRVLGGGVISDRDTVRLDLAEVSTDLEDLHGATDDADAVAVYHGEFLPGDAYEPWTEETRAEARARFLGAGQRLARRLLDHGGHAAAAGVARRLLAEDPYDGGAHRVLVTALLRGGHTGEARRAHARWREAMAELGLIVTPVETLDAG